MISVITPVHETSTPFLEEAYLSLLAQTHQDFEWVLLENNGGKVPASIRQDRRIRVYEAPSSMQGIGALKRCAFLKAEGDVLVELDADDLLAPAALAWIDAAVADGADFVYSDFAEFKNDTWVSTWFDYPYGQHYGWSSYDTEYDGHPLIAMRAPPVTAHHLRYVDWAPNHVRAWTSRAYHDLGGHVVSMPVADDHDLVVRTYLAGKKMTHVPECLYFYRVHAKNTVALRNAAIRDATQGVYNKHIMALAEHWAHENGLDLIDLCGGIDPAPGYIAVDRVVGSDGISCDLNRHWPIVDHSVGILRASDAVEHLKDPVFTMNEAYRVLAPGGFFFIDVPSTSGLGAFCDPTHESFWNKLSFRYYTDPAFSKYVREFKGKFQLIRLLEWFPSAWHKENNVPYVQAHLVCMKDGYHPMGENLWRLYLWKSTHAVSTLRAVLAVSSGSLGIPMTQHPFFASQAARRDVRRAHLTQHVGAALRHTAAGVWNLRDKLNGDTGRPMTLPECIKQALLTTRELLQEFPFPRPPQLTYSGIKATKTAGHDNDRYATVVDGLLLINAQFQSESGSKNEVVIPVEIRQGSVIQPSVFLHDGTMSVISPSAVDALLKRGTFHQPVLPRGEFGAPLSPNEAHQWATIERSMGRQPRVNPGMYSLASKQAELRAAVRGQASYVAERTAQMGQQPARGELKLMATPGMKIGNRVHCKMKWDPEQVAMMSDNNVLNMLRSYALELGSKKEWRDWGFISNVEIDAIDWDKGEAEISFQSSEISAPQLAGPGMREASLRTAEFKPGDKLEGKGADGTIDMTVVRMDWKGMVCRFFGGFEMMVEPTENGQWKTPNSNNTFTLKKVGTRTAAQGPGQNDCSLQPAERPNKDKNFHIGDDVKLRTEYPIVHRGGVQTILPKGTKGKVTRDLFGDGLHLQVTFEDARGIAIPASHLKKASVESASTTKTAAATKELVMQEISDLRQAGYGAIDAILTARQRYGELGEIAIREAKAAGLLDY